MFLLEQTVKIHAPSPRQLHCSSARSQKPLKGAREFQGIEQGAVAYLTYQLQPFNGLFSRTTRVSRYQKGKTNRDFTGARDSEWQWHQLSHMQVCTSLQTDNHASTPPLCFLQAGCPSCRPTNSAKALKASTQCTKFRNISASHGRVTCTFLNKIFRDCKELHAGSCTKI